MLVRLTCTGDLKGGLHSQGCLLSLLLVPPLCQGNPLSYIQLLMLSMPPAPCAKELLVTAIGLVHKLTRAATVSHMQAPDAQSDICATLNHSSHEL